MGIVKRQSVHSVKKSKTRNTKAVKPSLSGAGSRRARVVVVRKEEGSGEIDLQDLVITKNGTFYAPEGVAYKTITVNIQEYAAPTLTVSLSPATTLLDKVSESLSQLTVSAKVVKGSVDVKRISFYVNNTVISELTSGVENGGIFTATKNFDPATNENVSVKVVVVDSENKEINGTASIVFVGKTYYGILASTVTDPSEAQIKAINQTLKASKSYTYSGINMVYGKVVYAYPSSLGVLTSIMDPVNQLNYTDSFTLKQVEVDGINYNVYLMTEPAAAEDVTLSFN